MSAASPFEGICISGVTSISSSSPAYWHFVQGTFLEAGVAAAAGARSRACTIRTTCASSWVARRLGRTTRTQIFCRSLGCCSTLASCTDATAVIGSSKPGARAGVWSSPGHGRATVQPDQRLHGHSRAASHRRGAPPRAASQRAAAAVAVPRAARGSRDDQPRRGGGAASRLGAAARRRLPTRVV